MTLTFAPLDTSHFPLLLKWLEAPHVKRWWDPDTTYTRDTVTEKYATYVQGYKQVGAAQKPMHAAIIYVEECPIGYIQCYNAYDFSRSRPLIELPQSLGAFDIFIGDAKYLGQHWGSRALSAFLNTYHSHYANFFADPYAGNTAAIRCYARAGFQKIVVHDTDHHTNHEDTDLKDMDEVWMLKASAARRPASSL